MLDFTGFRADEIAVLLASNDGIDENWNGDGDDWQDDINFYGAAWVVTARFRNSEEAQAWIDREGLPGTCKENSNTTVIRFGEE